MSSLVRTRTGNFTLADAVTVDELDNMTFEERLKLPKPVESLFTELQSVNVVDYYAKLIRGGANIFQKKVKANVAEGELVRIYNRGVFIALGRGDIIDGVPVIRQEKLFVLEDLSAKQD